MGRNQEIEVFGVNNDIPDRPLVAVNIPAYDLNAGTVFLHELRDIR